MKITLDVLDVAHTAPLSGNRVPLPPRLLRNLATDTSTVGKVVNFNTQATVLDNTTK